MEIVRYRIHIPNFITLLRLLLVVPYVLSFYYHQYHTAFYIFIIAAISDYLDGYLARKFNWRTWIGAILDPLSDKFLVTVSFFMLWQTNILPTYLCVIVILRDVALLFGSMVLLILTKTLNTTPSFISKVNTCLQLAIVIFTLMDITWLPINNYFKQFLYITTFMTCIASGIIYLKLAIERVAASYNQIKS